MMDRRMAGALLAMSRQLQQRVPAILRGHPGIEGGERLMERVRDLTAVSLIPMMHRQVPAAPERVEALRHDLDQLWAVWCEAALQAEAGTAISVFFGPVAEANQLILDIAAQNGEGWTQVEVAGGFEIGSERWTAVRTRAEHTLLGRRFLHGGDTAPPSVAYAFPNGATQGVKAALGAMGIDVVDRTIGVR